MADTLNDTAGTVYLLPEGADDTGPAGDGDYVLRPGGDGYEVGQLQGSDIKWSGSVPASVLPDLPKVDEPTEAPDQQKLLTAVGGIITGQVEAGG